VVESIIVGIETVMEVVEFSAADVSTFAAVYIIINGNY
jgi:hypothetical protein